MSDQLSFFQEALNRAALPIVVLSVLHERPMYGYELTTEIKKRSHGTYPTAVMYPVLKKLLQDHYIELGKSTVIDGRYRQYYQITQLGESALADSPAEFKQFTDLLNEIMEGPSHD